MKNPMNLENKTILVTGASSGIGRAVSLAASEFGAKVIMIARHEEKLLETLKALSGEGHKYYSYDLKNIEGIEAEIKRIVEENGKLDGFVHCAGVGTVLPLNMTSFERLNEIMAINFYAFAELLRVYSKKKNNNNGGSVAAISSIASTRGKKGQIAYSASKAALDAVVRVSALELKEKGIRVNSVQPGWVGTEMSEQFSGLIGRDEAMRSFDQFGVAEPEEIANVISFLLSDASSAVSGCNIVVNSGGVERLTAMFSNGNLRQ